MKIKFRFSLFNSFKKLNIKPKDFIKKLEEEYKIKTISFEKSYLAPVFIWNCKCNLSRIEIRNIVLK